MVMPSSRSRILHVYSVVHVSVSKINAYDKYMEKYHRKVRLSGCKDVTQWVKLQGDVMKPFW